MKELHINLTVTALTLVVVCSIGALAEGLGKNLYQPGEESLTFAAEHKMPRSEARAPMKIADAEEETAPAPAKGAMN